MADEFTTLCINKLKAKIEEIYSDYAWYTEYAMHNTKGERISIDLYGETAKSKILIEFEMHRRQPGDNAHKLLILDASRKRSYVSVPSDAPGEDYRMPGSVDGDGDLDVFDVIDTINAFGTVPGDPLWNPDCDFDGNGAVDIFDLIDCVNNFGIGT